MSKLLDYTGLGRFLDKLKILFIQKPPTAIQGNITVFNGEGSVIDGGKSIAQTQAVFFGTIDSTSTAAELTATVNGLTEIVPGTTVYIYNGVISGSSSCTLNINNLGALSIYRGGNEYSRVGFSKNHTWQLIYNPVRVTGGCWDMQYGQYSYVNLGYYDRESSYSLIAKEEMEKPTYVFHYSETELVPLYNGTSLTTLDFDPFSKIYWMSSHNHAANTAIAATDLYTRTNSGDLRSWVSEFTPHKQFFIKCIPLVDSNNKRTGRVQLAPQPFAQELPTTEDGFVYILMGVISSTLYSLEFQTTHPIFEFKNGALRLWINQYTPTKTSELTNDSGFLTQHQDISGKADSATTLAGYGITDAKIENGTITLGSNTITPLTAHQSLSNYVTLDGNQTITGEKTFSGDKRIKFKQSAAANKLGFTLYNNSSNEVGNFEWQPSGINSKPTLVLGQWRETTAVAQGYLGFKLNDVPGSAYYALVTPLPADAKTPLGLSGTATTLYLPLQFKNGSSTVTTASTGVVDLSTLLSNYLTQTTFDTNNADLAAIEALTGTSGVLVKTAANTWALSNSIGGTLVVNHGTSDTTFTLTENTYHKWGSVSSLTLTLSTPVDNTKLNEYIFSFTSPATPTTLSVPASVNWVTPLDIEPNKEYRVSIIDNLATWITSDMVVPIGDVNTPEFATKAYVDAGLALKEDSSNKVTSIDENSTDTQYPSAKAMYDALNPE